MICDVTGSAVPACSVGGVRRAVPSDQDIGLKVEPLAGLERTVYAVPPLTDDLGAYRWSEERSGLILPNRHGGYLDLRTWRRRIWKPAAERAGVDATPYDLRHTYASLLIHENRSPVDVAARMGNSPALVLGTYAHPFAEQEHATAVKMEDAIANARRDVLKTYSPVKKRRQKKAA